MGARLAAAAGEAVTVEEFAQAIVSAGASGVSVWRTATGWQANVKIEDGWRVHAAATLEAALRDAAEALAPKPSFLE